ncbi:MAG: OmpA family protein [Anaerolineales bacterium]|nr:OmpA family protein [Anaerolineales bacterium]
MSHGSGGGHGGGGDERWLVSYADFITLLMVLFVVLYSMSQVDVARYRQLADGLRAAFDGNDPNMVDPEINLGGLGDDEAPAPIIVSGIPNVPAQSTEIAGQLTDLLSMSDLGSMVSDQNNIEGVLISVSERLLFVQGTAELQPDAYPVLDTVVEMINAIDNEVRVIGYTDDSPPQDPRYLTNWELSVGRALTIVTYLQAKGVAPERLIAMGRGEYAPLFNNDTPDHRTLNSRAEIIIVYPMASEILNLNVFEATDQDPTDSETNENPPQGETP